MSTSIRLKQSSAWVALVALASASANGNPNDTEESHGVKVNYEDLNPNTLAGASILYHRIESAARQVCGANADPVPHGQWKACYRMALAAAVAKVDSPWLTAIHDTKSGGPKLASLRRLRARIG
jgi:UrcA family protein